jgi:hypothetical protein
VALAVPVGITYAVAWLGWQPFIFEHLVVLLVVVIALPYGLGPAVVAAATSVVADNVLLREPIGRPTITGYRDVLDLLLFAAVAVVISELVRRADSQSKHSGRRRELAGTRDVTIAPPGGEFNSEITLPCKLLKTDKTVREWVPGIRTKSLRQCRRGWPPSAIGPE